MSDNSAIEWTDATWNPTTGCTKVSPGCDNCYAERIVERFKGKGAFAVVTRSEEKLYAPFKWRKPRLVFVNSMSDLFHDDVPTSFIAKVFSVMARTPQHTYQLLTKRHGRMRSLLNNEAFRGLVADAVGADNNAVYSRELVGWPLPNVWLGVSVENQQWADTRIPALLATSAAVRFLSCEPLVGPIDLTEVAPGTVYSNRGFNSLAGLQHIDWVIAGGESGPGARPMHPEWARGLRDQCQANGVAFHFKQWGAFAPVSGTTFARSDTEICADGYTYPLTEPHDRPDGSFCDDGTAVVVRRVGKGAAGRMLDGRTWDEFPQAVTA